MERRGHLLVVLAGGALLFLPGSLPYAVGVPTLLSPMPLAPVLPAFLEVPGPVVGSIPAIVFWSLGWSLFKHRERMGFGPLIFYAVLAALNVVMLIASWGYGLRYEGPVHTAVVATMSVVLSSCGLGLSAWARRRPSFARHFAAHWVLALWLAWCAFPYLGELP
jgi:hypothetical protein